VTADELVANIPEELRAERAWCVWRFEDRQGKPTKIPIRPDGRAFRSNDSTTWCDFAEAVAALERGGFAGLGRAVTAPYTGIDMDWKHLPEGAPPPEWLGRVLSLLDSWTEVSPSGRGAHVWIRGTWSGPRQTRFPGGSMLEAYDSSSPRYFTTTGQTMLTSPATIRSGPEAQAALDQLAAELVKITAPKARAKGNGAGDGDELVGAPEGQRRAVLTSEAGRLRALGVNRGEARAVLQALAARCTPPVPEDDADKILEWAWTKAAGEPRHCPVCGEPEPCANHLATPPRPEIETPDEDIGAAADRWEERREKADDMAARRVDEKGDQIVDTPGDRRARKAKCGHVLDPQAICTLCGLSLGLDVQGLSDATLVAARGRTIAEEGVRFVVDGIIPNYGMLGMLIAYTKVGKTTLGHALGAAVSRGEAFLGRKTTRARVLYIAAEDPPEYTDYLARNLVTEPGAMTFYQRGVILNDAGLKQIAATARQGGYGLILVASWQAVVRGLIRDENDNAGAAVVVEDVKAVARESHVPWLIDAHSGRNEDQADDADPTRALRGASSAAAAADYLLSLRYSDGAFGYRRRLSGRGRFVNVPPETIVYDPDTGQYESLGSTKSASAETTWRVIQEAGAVTAEPRSVDVIARTAGLANLKGKIGGQARKRVRQALDGREGITRTESTVRGQKTVMYALALEEAKA
jgi:AAA domain